MTAVMDEFDRADDAVLIVEDLLVVDESGDPVGEVVTEEIITFDSEGNEQIVYESIYVADESAE